MGTSVRPTGMASGAAALRYWERRQEVASNNLANVSTDGFKGERVFSRLVEDGLPVPDAATNFSPGTLQVTGNPFDVALEGEGFFVVHTPHGERFSRGGTLQLSSDGTLLDSSGHSLVGKHGPIRLQHLDAEALSVVDISRTGIITVNGKAVDRLRLETVPPTHKLQREGAGLFIPPPAEERQSISPDATIVRQGVLEASNVSPIEEMVDMIAIQRAYSAVQKSITTLDAARGIAVTELGRPAN